MKIEEMREAVEEAGRVLRRRNQLIYDMAEMIAGNLKGANISCWTLEKLKRELKDYNIHTGSWKE